MPFGSSIFSTRSCEPVSPYFSATVRVTRRDSEYRKIIASRMASRSAVLVDRSEPGFAGMAILRKGIFSMLSICVRPRLQRPSPRGPRSPEAAGGAVAKRAAGAKAPRDPIRPSSRFAGCCYRFPGPKTSACRPSGSASSPFLPCTCWWRSPSCSRSTTSCSKRTEPEADPVQRVRDARFARGTSRAPRSGPTRSSRS